MAKRRRLRKKMPQWSETDSDMECNGPVHEGDYCGDLVYCEKCMAKRVPRPLGDRLRARAARHGLDLQTFIRMNRWGLPFALFNILHYLTHKPDVSNAQTDDFIEFFSLAMQLSTTRSPKRGTPRRHTIMFTIPFRTSTHQKECSLQSCTFDA